MLSYMDAATSDQLIATMIYDGTHPNHHFTIKWGPCRKSNQDQQTHQTIDVNLLDDDGNDAATKTYTELVTISLANLSCRPATVTLWTPPNFDRSIDVPSRP